jgi:transposase
MKERIILSREQLKQAHVLRKYNEKLLSRAEAAKTLGKSERQVTRLAKGMREQGEEALIHKNTGRKPVHALTEEKKAQIVAIRKEEVYEGCNINYFQELLEREHAIKVSYTSLYRLLNNAGIKSPKKHRKEVKHRRRKRRQQAGELVQFDASPHDWFGTGESFTLHGAIDDATGKPTGLYMTKNECLQGYFAVMRQTCLNFGVPLSCYSDRHTIFRSPSTSKKEEAGEEANLTQFGRALDELGIELIFAHSPQAKGRIERFWGTLQGRLVIEFKLRGITTVEAANLFLANEFIAYYGDKFGVEAGAEPIFVPYSHRENINDILCVKVNRKTDNAGTFSCNGIHFKVLDEGYPLIPAKSSVEVLIGLQDSVRVRYKGRVFGTVVCDKPKRRAHANKAAAKVDTVKPHLVHGSDEWRKVWHYEDYDETLAFLYDIFFKATA